MPGDMYLLLIVLLPAVWLFVAPNRSASTPEWLCGKVWNGKYRYNAGKPGRRSKAAVDVPFEMVFFCGIERVNGRILEPATFGRGVDTLSSLVSDVVVRGDRIGFTKTYDGSGGEHHSVFYRGQISKDRKAISGGWSLYFSKGEFEMKAT